MMIQDGNKQPLNVDFQFVNDPADESHQSMFGKMI